MSLYVVFERVQKDKEDAMNIIIQGGTGHIGRLLTHSLRGDGHRVIVLSRTEGSDPYARVWDGRTLGDWADVIEGADAVVNLAGRSVDCRYTAAPRAEILRSRVASTRVIGEAIARAVNPPRIWLQMSTATIYAHRFDAANDEDSGILGGEEPDVPHEWKFSIDVARAWEEALDAAVTPRTRKVKLRSAMVMNPDPGGAFHAILRHVRLGFGRFGDGNQYVSWIHGHDFVRAIRWLLGNHLRDAVNLASPNPLPMRDFIDILGDTWGARLRVPVSGPVLEFGAFIARTEPELVLKSRRVVPRRLLDGGFKFEFGKWPEAARDLCEHWRHHDEGKVW